MNFTATGCTGIQVMTAHHSYDSPQATLSVTCTGYSGSLNDNITAAINGTTVMTGQVKRIIRRRDESGYLYTIEAYDILIRATDYFIAADDPDNPFEADNISAEDLVEDLLNLASITGYTATSPGLTLATTEAYGIDRVFVWDMVKQIASFCAYHIWTDATGTVHFESLPPTPGVSADHTIITGNSGTLLGVDHLISEESLRNRVVVYGLNNITGVASAVSPHLPAGYYKTAVFGHPIIDTQAAADAAAAYNLTLWNRLTEEIEIECVGDETIAFGETISVTEPFTETSGLWFAKEVVHRISKAGYVTQMTLSK